MTILDKETNLTKKTQVMIVEDEGLIAADIKSSLRGLGYHVSGIAGSADEARELAGMFVSQIVLMDIKIRGPIDGIELAKELRHRYQTPIIFLTSNTDASTFARAESTAPFGFVTKPYTEFHLKAAIELALSRSEAERKSRRREEALSAVLESLHDAIIATDTDGHIVLMNKTAETLTGCSAEAALGRDVGDVLQLSEIDASELVADIYSGDLLNVSVSVAASTGHVRHCRLSGSALMKGTKKSGAVLLLRGPAIAGDGTDAAALQATEDMLSTLCLLRLDEATRYTSPSQVEAG